MFKRIQISSLGIKAALVLTAPLSLGLDASDPCSGRKFCGNFTIIYNGAGENLAADPNRKGVDPAARNTVQFLDKFARGTNKNTRVLLLSSDSTPAVAKAVSQASERMGDKFSHIPTSKPSFEDYLKNDAALEQMKQAFAKDPECQQLMKANPGADVSKFIKMEIYVASHSLLESGRFKGLPVWPNDTDKGEDEYHSELVSLDTSNRDSKTNVQSKDFEQLRNAFGGSVTNTTVVTCDAADVGNMITPISSDSCSCFSAYTDSGVSSVVYQHDKRSVLDDSLKKNINSSSLQSFTNPMQNYNRWTLMGDSPTGGAGTYDSPIFTIQTNKENHFDLFALTSADVQAEEILKSTPSTPMLTEAKIKLVSDTSDKDFEVAFREVEALAKKAREKNNEYIASLGRDPESLKRSREGARDFFNNCIFKPQADDRMCSNFKDLLNLIGSKQSEHEDFAEVAKVYPLVRSDLGEMADSPIMTGKNDDPVKFLATYRKYAENFAHFRNALTRAARKLGRADELVAPLKAMSTKWATYHSAYINAYFPDVVGDTLNRRVANYTKAAELLKAKYIETNDPKYKKKLERLRSQLACVLNFPLGPDYKESNEYPVGRLIVDSSNSSGSPLGEHVKGKESKSSSSEQRPALR